MLRTSAPVPTSTEACLDAETIAAWHDGGLTGSALATAEAHLANCDRCQAVVKILVRDVPALQAAQPARKLWLRWVLPLAAAATAVAIWVAVPGTPRADVVR